MVVYTSLERIRRAADLEPARTSEDEVEQLTEIVGLSGLVLAGPFQRAALDPELEDEIGFDVTRVDATLSAGSAPDDLAILAGRLDTDDIDEALTSYELWADAVEVGAQGSVATYRFGDEGGIDVERRSAARSLGESVRVGVADGTMSWTRSDATFAASLAAANDGPSLLDDPGIASAAAALGEAGAWVAALIADP